MALTKDRNTPRRPGEVIAVAVAAEAHIYAGSIVAAKAAGYAAPATAAAGLLCLGRAEEEVDNTGGADGAVKVLVRRGVFQWNNSAAAADKITAAHIGRTCYMVDDETVAKTHAVATRSAAGTVVAVDSTGVWVSVAAGGPVLLRGRGAAVDFANLAGHASNHKDIAVPGAEPGDLVLLGIPIAADSGVNYSAYVQAANKVRILAQNTTAGAINPAAGVFHVAVLK